MDSTAALDLPRHPEALLVVGGGYIGLELGTVYAALGTKVTVVEMTPGLLPGADRDLVAVLAKRIEKTSARPCCSNTRVVEHGRQRRRDQGDVRGRGRRPARSRCSNACWCRSGAGRTRTCPGLEKTPSRSTRSGFIEVDAQRRTAEPTIFAIGDVAGEPMLAHKASHEGRVAVEAIAGENAAFEPAAIPAVVFTDPELAWCGLTEEEAPQARPARSRSPSSRGRPPAAP